MRRSFDLRTWQRTLRALLVMTSLAPALAWPAPLDLAWPQFRHDVTRSNFSPGKGHLDVPTVKWRLPLGGAAVSAQFLDVDFDGRDDVVSIEGGHVTARSSSGQVLWSSPQLAAASLHGFGDVDGDGTPEVAVAADNRAHLVRTSDGSVLWSSPVQAPHVGFVSLGDFDGDGVLDVAVGAHAGAGSDLPPTTQIVGFSPALKTIAVTAVSPTGVDMPQVDAQGAVDVDGDGALDLLLPGYAHLYAFSGKTGQLLGQSPAFATIGQAGVVMGSFRPDPKQPPIVLFAADSSAQAYLMHGVIALQLQGSALQVLWSSMLPELATQHYVTVRGSMADLDGDGVGEVMAAKFDQGAWQLEVRDAATGSVLHTLSAAQMAGPATGGPFLRGIVRPIAGATAYMVVQRAPTATIPAIGDLRLVQWTRVNGFVPGPDLGDGTLCTANWHFAATSGAVANPDPIPALQAWGDPAVAQGDLLIERDTDGDFALDQLDHMRISKDGFVLSVAKMPLPFGTQVLGVASAGPSLLKALVRGDLDGTVGFFNDLQVLTNDANKDGHGDLRFGGLVSAYLAVAPVKNTDKAGRVLVSTSGSVRLLDTSAAGPLTEPSVALSLPTPTAFARGNFADVNGDGSRDVVVRSATASQAAVLSAYNVDGSALWTYAHADEPWQWGLTTGDPFAIVDVNGDGGEDLVCQWDPQDVAQKQKMTVISGKTGLDLWPADATCRLGYCAFSVDMTSSPVRLLASAYTYRYQCDAVTGKVIEEFTPTEPRSGVAMLTDLDGDGLAEEVLCGSSEGLAAEKTVGFKSLWKFSVPGAYSTAGALVLTGTEPLAAQASSTQPLLQVVAAKTGQAVWSAAYMGGKRVTVEEGAPSGFATAGLLAAADLTGAGHPSLLFRTTEGCLYAVNALTGAVDWALNWGGEFGDPIVADIDGDGELEMLAVASDGALYAFDHSDLLPVAWVRENDGTAPALSDAADIDVQEDSRTLHANWAADPGAQGYAVSVLDQNGTTVLPAQSFGAETQATLTGLTMHLGQHYTVAVQAYSAAGPGQAFAPTALSDGVTIVDLSPPWIDGQQLLPAAVLAGGTVNIVADLHDKTAVHDWRVTVAPTGGSTVWEVAQNATQPLVHINQSFSTTTTATGTPWAAGNYTVHVEVRDGAQHTASADMALHVCATSPFSTAVCSAKDIGGPDAGGGGDDVGGLVPSEEPGCGCRIAASRRSLPMGSLWFLGACLFVLWRARTPRKS